MRVQQRLHCIAFSSVRLVCHIMNEGKADGARRDRSSRAKPNADAASSQTTLSAEGTESTGTADSSVLSVASGKTGETGKTNKTSGETKAYGKPGQSTRTAVPAATGTSSKGVAIRLDSAGLLAEQDEDMQRKLHLAHLWEQVNFCGLYQYMVLFLTLVPNFMGGLVLLQNVFVLGTPHHRCFITGCDDRNFSNAVASSFIVGGNTSHTEGENHYVCTRYGVPGSRADTCDPTGLNRSHVVCNAGFVYDYASMAPSAVNEWGLVCEKEGQALAAKAVFMSGMLFSSVICGSLADQYGRISTYWWAPSLLVVMGILSANSSGIWLYTFASFFMSFCAYGMVISDFTLGVEVVPKNRRIRAGNGYPITFAMGQGVMALVFYLCQNWRHALLVISALNASLIFMPLLMPESVKWRIAQGGKHQHHKAKKEIYRIARINKVVVNELADDKKLDPDTVAQLAMKPPSWLEMTKSKLMVRWVVNLCFGWFFAALTYYGVTFATGNLASNIYWSFVLMAFIEVPFVLSLTLFMRWFGRRTLYCGSFFLTSVAALVAALLPHRFAIYLALCVKGFISIALNLCYVYTVEIFPSVSRTRGLGFCSMFARLGTIVSPFAADMKWVGSSTPLIFFGVICLIYGFMALDLPETKGKELPETLADLRKLKMKKPP